MPALDPLRIFRRLCHDIPGNLRQHIIVTGSLAAAYEYRLELQARAVNTKDADLVVHPAGDVLSARDMAQGLLALGWQRTEKCFPPRLPIPFENLRAIRLTPPATTDYFIELLNVPLPGQDSPKVWIPVQLLDGWYALPSFKFMGLTACEPRLSKEGLEYAAPAMMALANLLSHPRISDDEIESGEFRGLRRCAKDLGRVIALASLAGRDATTGWPLRWRQGLQTCFPQNWPDYARFAGRGLRAMLADDEVLDQARQTTEAGLLNGKGYDAAALKGFAQRLLDDAIEPLERLAAADPRP